MSLEMIVVIAGMTGVISFMAILLVAKVPKRLNKKKYTQRWRALQSHCKDKGSWKEAIISADKLLDRALRQRKFKGGRPGERMVSAQRHFSDNDGIWFAHSLYKKIIASPDMKLKEADVKRALTNFRQALRDLGALPNGEAKNK